MKHLGLVFYLSVFIFIASTNLIAQYKSQADSQSRTSSDSTFNPIKTKIYSENVFDRQSSAFTTPDSSLNNLQNYRNHYNLGNSGLAIANLYVPQILPTVGFNYAPNNFQSYLLTPHATDYFNTRTPYTELFFLAGAKNELYSNFIHTQNVNKNLNFAAKFQRIRSDGFYNRQNANHTSFSLSSNYHTSDNRYLLISNFTVNSLNNAENGGLSQANSDSARANGPLQDRKSFAPILQDANRHYRSTGFYFKQFLNLGSKSSFRDSTYSQKVQPTSVIAHSFLIQREQISYSDPFPRSGFYSGMLRDTNRTDDSTKIFRLENELSWRLMNRRLGASFGLKQQYINLSQFVAADTVYKSVSIQTIPNSLIPFPEQVVTYTPGPQSHINLPRQSFNNFMFIGELYSNSAKNLQYGIRGEYDFAGYNAGDYSLSAAAKLNLSEDTSQFIGLYGLAADKRPDYMYMNYFSNNFNWTNNFSQVSSINLKLFYRWAKYKLELGVQTFQYKNFVCLTADGPVQVSSNSSGYSATGFSAYICKTFYLGHFVFKNKITWQQVPDSAVIHLPVWVTEHSLFYENTLFKKALRFQIGVDVFYNSSYFANGYLPQLGQFYVQNPQSANSLLIGNYPYVDLFLNLKISRARIFVKYENVNAYLGDFSYSYAPHYPWTDAAFKLGVIWRFFD